MKKRKTAREMESEAAAAHRPPRHAGLPPRAEEAVAMLVRRGLRPRPTSPDLPFPPDFAGEAAERLSEQLGHYAFRLFLRGAIQKALAFTPAEATQYVRPAQSGIFAESLVGLGLAVKLSEGLKLHAPGVGGDLNVVAAAEGKLIYLELKSSPPKHLSAGEVAAFFDRLRVLRPDAALFVMDTALRLSDKVLPMLVTELTRRRGDTPGVPRQVRRELWALTPHLYAVNAKPDLLANIGRAIAEGLRAVSPPPC